MRVDFRLPDIGEGVAEGEVTEWHIAPGDQVREDDPMVEVMTDKATVTIGAPCSGRIAKLGAEVGATVAVGEVLVVIESSEAGSSVADAKEAGGANGSEPQAAAAAAPAGEAHSAQGGDADTPAATAVGDVRDALPGSEYFSDGGATRVAPVSTSAQPAYFADKPLATPATRKLARDLGIDLRRVPPSGASGRVTNEDVRALAGPTATVPGAPSVAAPAVVAHVPAASQPQAELRGNGSAGRAPSVGVPTSPGETRVPFVGLRRKIAERLQYSKNTAAHFTFVEECEVDRLVELRERLKPKAAQQGVSLSFLPFIAKAVTKALATHPMLNCALDVETNELVMHPHVHLGIAAATEHGLMVPVVPHAERISLLELARQIDRVGNGAREGELSAAELTGSTFTITSLGKQSGLFATPVLNPPEVGILGVHRIKDRPVVRNGAIVPGKVMLLALSLDHRIVDGHVGAAFMYNVIEYLQDPATMLFDMI